MVRAFYVVCLWIGVLIVFCGCRPTPEDDWYADKILREVRSPSGKFIVTIVDRDPGLADPVVIVFLKRRYSLFRKAITIVGNGGVPDVTFESENALTIHIGMGKVFRKISEAYDVTIKYE